MNLTEAERIFHSALRVAAGAERSAFLEVECGSDGELRRTVERLLAALEEAPGFLHSPTRAEGEPILTERPGTSIGRYRLLQRLGEGGFGVVYMAEQREPVKRRVALKIIKLGLDTKQVVARFEIERQALAMMDHPNIARVFDAGATEQGRPYFVMELVRGIPITEYCDENRLETKDRLELFMKVCRAVQHAHQKGVIHRDLKPRNILVTLHDGVPVPKVIDFGIAKATQHELTEKTVFTEFHQMIGTPAYMSPEQAEMSGLDIDTRSDIYALGVLLYELLTGRTPLDGKELMSAGYDEMRRRIRMEEPLRPSTRVASFDVAERTEVARRRKLDGERLGGELRGDLDWIVMKALEKDRTRRYDTAQGLANDIGRHLNREPVEAVAPTFAYRSRKFIDRNRLVLTVSSVIAVLLVAGTTVSTWQAVRASRASVRERDAKVTAQLAEREARAGQLAARRNQYAAELTLASQAIDAGNVDRGINLLQRQIPREGEEDLRGFEWAYLWEEVHRGRMELSGHRTDVYDVAISPDGRYVASSSDEETLLWDFHSGQELARIPRQGAISGRVDFSPDGTLLATTSDKEVVLWDVLARKEVDRLNADSDLVNFVRFAPDGQLLYVCSPNGEIQVWDLPTRQVRLVQAHRWWPGKIGFSRDGSRLVTSGAATVKIWDRRTMKCLVELTDHTAGVNDVACAPHMDVAVSCDRSGNVFVWDVLKGERLRALALNVKRQGPVKALAFSTDGSFLVAGFEGGRISFLRTEDWVELGSTDSTSLLNLALSPVGNRLVVAGREGRLIAQEFSFDEDRGLLTVADDQPRCIKLSPDGATMAVGMEGGAIRVWDLGTERELLSIPHYPWHDRFRQNPFDLQFFDFAPDGRSFVTLTDTDQLDVWDIERAEIAFSLQHSNRLYSVGWSRSGDRIAAGGPDGQVTIWDTKRRRPIGQIQAHESRVHLLVYSPDGKHLATSSWDSAPMAKIKIWDADTGGLVKELTGHLNEGGPGAMAFSPDGALLATGASDRRVVVWNTADWSERAALFGHVGPIADLAFSADGTRLASGGFEGVIRLWDVGSFQEVATLDGSLVEFGPRDSVLVTAETLLLQNAPSSAPGRVVVHRPPSVAEIDRQLRGF